MKAFRLALWVLTLWVGTAIAQTVEDIDLTDWENFATLTERILTENRVSEDRIGRYRAELSDWRSEFQTAQGLNAARIETLTSQLDALGAVPEDASTEPETVAEERAELTEQLAEARAPSLRAEAAFVRADALIAQIDREIRDRQTDAFFQLSETPLNPATWPVALAAFQDTLRHLVNEVSVRTASDDDQAQLREAAPLTLALIVMAILFVIRGPVWTSRVQENIAARSHGLGADFWRFLISLGEIVLPVLGLTALIGAVRVTGILGPAGTEVAITLNQSIFAIAVGRWLARRIFPQTVFGRPPIEVSAPEAAEARWWIRILALLLAGYFLVREIAVVGGHADELIAVLTFPFIVTLGIALLCLARVLLVAHDQADDISRFSKSLLRWLGQFVRAVSIIGPIAAAVGYTNMGAGLVIPTVLSLALIAVLLTLHVAVRAGWGLLCRLTSDEVDSALMPILATFSLTVAAIPLFALTWGARSTDLSEILTQFLNGMEFGETRIRPGDFLTLIFVFAIGFGATRLIQGALRTSVLPRTRLDPGGQSALISGLGYVGVTLAAVFAITAAGIDLSSLALVVGALGVGIGFGLQNIVNNFVSGIIMLIERPISEGDWVEVNGHMGIVKTISVRSTRVETFDRTDVIVPNGDFISGTVTNWTRGNSVGRVQLDVGVAYGTDTRKVAAILSEICAEHPMVAREPKPAVYFQTFGADSLEFRVYCILKDVNFILSVHSDLNHAVHERFVAEGIEIPFAQRDVWLRNPEALTPGRQVPPTASVPSSQPSTAAPMDCLLYTSPSPRDS